MRLVFFAFTTFGAATLASATSPQPIIFGPMDWEVAGAIERHFSNLCNAEACRRYPKTVKIDDLKCKKKKELDYICKFSMSVRTAMLTPEREEWDHKKARFSISKDSNLWELKSPSSF